MAVTSKDLHATRDQQRVGSALPRHLMPVVSVVTFGVAALALYILIGTLVSWGQVSFDDIRYGRPRTMHLEGFVGRPEEANGQPTHFIALNLQRQVIVLELPGGDANLIRSLPGPYLFGANEELTPVVIALHDIDGDGQSDLLITVRNEQVVYLNRDGAFRLPTAEEQRQLIQGHGQ